MHCTKEKFDVVRQYFEYIHFNQYVLPNLRDHCPSCNSVVEYNNKKKEVRSIKAPANEGQNHPSRRQQRRIDRGSTKAQDDQSFAEDIRSKKENAGIYLCSARCPETFHYCRSEYLTEKGLSDHRNKGSHEFPSGISAKDKLVGMASKPGGLVAIGGRVNRRDKSAKTFAEALADSKGVVAANCFRAFNRVEDRKVIHKTEAHVVFLREIFFRDGPNSTAAQAREEMRIAIDEEDGGLKFCNSKRGTFMAKTGKNAAAYEAWPGCSMCGEKPCECNGPLLPESTITSFFSSLAAQQKKAGKMTKKQAEVAATHAALLFEQQQQTNN